MGAERERRMTSWRENTGWKEWTGPLFPYNARPPRPGLFARLLGWLRR